MHAIVTSMGKQPASPPTSKAHHDYGTHSLLKASPNIPRKTTRTRRTAPQQALQSLPRGPVPLKDNVHESMRFRTRLHEPPLLLSNL
jgi:hypothetical protein